MAMDYAALKTEMEDARYDTAIQRGSNNRVLVLLLDAASTSPSGDPSPRLRCRTPTQKLCASEPNLSPGPQ